MRSRPLLDLGDAQVAVQAGIDEAARNGWAVSVAVVDDAGMMLALARMDGAGGATADFAIRKAKAAAFGGCETLMLDQAVEARPALATSGLMMVEGGVPVVGQGLMLGGIGVSGVTPDQDAQVARAALAAMELV